MKLPDELKEAISSLSSNEKDKLIFRLLKKDLTLANRLLFELVSEKSVEQAREEVKNKLGRLIQKNLPNFYSCGYLNMEVRELSGIINQHVSVTKDKFGEISLNLFMINHILAGNREHILSKSEAKAKKFCTAVIARAFKIMLLIKKMHEDYFIEFQEDVQTLGNLIAENPHLLKAANDNGLDVNWLISEEIPDDIAKIHRNLRDNGFL